MGKYEGTTAEIQLTQGKVALVDADDFVRVSKYKWQAKRTSNDKGWYVARTAYNPKRTVFLSRFILDAPDDLEVDHVSLDGLDNRRGNLRLCTRGQNCRNRLPYASSGFKGVYPNRYGWAAKIRYNKRLKHLGTFKTKEEAAAVYDAAAKSLDPQFARTNGLG